MTRLCCGDNISLVNEGLGVGIGLGILESLAATTFSNENGRNY